MTTIRAVLARMQCLHCIQTSATVMEAARMMVSHNIGAMPVLDGDRLVGLFSERDLLKRVVGKGLDPATTKITDVMTTELVTVDINDNDATCLQKMTEHKCRHLPVVENGRLVAFISARDLMKSRVEGMGQEIKTLTDYIHYVPPTQE